nr:unnamed protein product [Digitaria exilis]
MARGPLDLWNEWATQILVLLSLTLQVVLLLFAGIRRREASMLPTFLLWLAYLMADSTAIYAVGHLSLSSVPVDHQLVAFWAPFLLLHPGGPDNITAYSLEDSKLWLRHLLNLVVQVLGAAYVLYKYVAGGDSFILLAPILMFGVGVLKYGERTLALKRSNLDSIRRSVEKQVMEDAIPHQHFHPPDYGSMVAAVEGDEFYIRRAHSMFHVCKRAIVDSWVVRVEKDPESQSFSEERNHQAESQRLVVDMDIKKEEDNYSAMWTLMEMELSLMYDLLYTKAGIIHTWSGYTIRVASSLAAAASLMLFKFSNKGGHSTVDVAVSYLVGRGLRLGGSITIESASVNLDVRLPVQHAVELAPVRCSLHWKVGSASLACQGDHRKRWGEADIGEKIAWMLGYEDWWIRYHYSGTVQFPEDLKRRMFKYIKHLTSRSGLNMQGVIRRNWGRGAFRVRGEMDLYNSLYDANLLGVEFQEGIIIWHIATEVFIAESRGPGAEDSGGLVKTIRTLSNYIIFLLVDRPYMLPGLAHRMLYRQTCDNLADIQQHSSENQRKGMCTKLKDFFRLYDGPRAGGKHVEDLAKTLYKEKPTPTLAVPRLYFSYLVARKLIRRIEETGRVAMLKLLRDVWIDFLVYAANRCSRESHAKRLGNGGELTTILWLMTDYLHLQANNAAQDRH